MKRAAALMLAAAACGSGKAPSAERRAAAETAAAPAPRDAAAAADYDRSLRRGWDLAHAGDRAGAIAAFQAAVTARPDDARALNELAWAALHGGDLQLARTSAQHAMDVAKDPTSRAKALYNRGRVAEADGDGKTALALYQESESLRPNKDVERRIAALGAGSADAPAPKLAGPYAALDDFCADLGLPVAESGDPTLEDDVWCSPDPTPLAAKGWFDRAAVIHHADSIQSTSADLALHDARGWWVMADVDDAQLRDVQVAKP